MQAAQSKDWRWESAAAMLWRAQADLFRQLAATPKRPEAEDAERLSEALGAAGELIAGLEHYQQAPYERGVAAPPTVWRAGSLRLLDYGGVGPPVVVVPSLINRAWIMDLSESQSRMRKLSRAGFRAFLVDWGVPAGEERQFGIAAYVTERLRPAIAAAARISGAPVALAGYCMGGVLALAAAGDRALPVARIVTLATPWDFSHFSEYPMFRSGRDSFDRSLRQMASLFGVIPPRVIQAFFTMRDLPSSLRKFRRFASVPLSSEAAHTYVAVEDWLNIGAPLSAPVAAECFGDWFAGNALYRGEWHLGAERFDPAALDLPVLVVAGQGDGVVPPSSAEPLAEALPRARLLRTQTGHLTTILGSRAESEVWPRVGAFLRGAA